MSSIDNRIVDMKFNNAQFNSGVQGTLSALDKLKQGLNLDGAKKSLDGLSDAARRFTLEPMTKGVQSLMDHFSALQVVGVTAIATIANKAVNAGINIAKGMLIDKPLAGLAEYETKIGSIQTMVANTAKAGTSMEEINSVLDELNDYADKTIYNFGDMTRNIGLFTNAGIGVKDAASMIKGFSNEAASSGASASSAAGAAYQLSQALSAGTIRAMDWMSITNANMGNKNMQNGLIEIAAAMGMFNDDTTTASAAAANFKGTLEAGWLSADVMSTYLRIQAGELGAEQMKTLGLSQEQIEAFQAQQKVAEQAATKVRTWTQLIGTMAEATGSGWAQTMELVLGDFDEATELFTMISDVMGTFISDSAAARNAQIAIWADGGGRAAVVDSIRNIFDAILQIVTPIKEAYAEVFPPTLGETLIKISMGLKAFTEGLKIGADGSAKLKTAALAVFTVLKNGKAVVSGVISYIGDTVAIVFDLAKALLGLVAPIVVFAASLLKGKESAADASEGIGSFFDLLISARRGVIDPIITVITALGAAFDELLNGDPTQFGNAFRNALGPMGAMADAFLAKWSAVTDWLNVTFTGSVNGLTATWNRLGGGISATWGVIKQIASAVGGFFSSVGKMFADATSGITMEQVLAGINTAGLVAMVVGIKKLLQPASDIATGWADILKGTVGALEGLTKTFSAMQKDIKANILVKIAGAIALLAAAIWILASVDSTKLVSSTTALAVAAGILMGSMAIFSKIASTGGALKMPLIAASLILLAGALAIVAIAVKTLAGLSMAELGAGLLGITVAMGLMVGAVVILSKHGAGVGKAAASMIVMAGALYMLAGVVAIFAMIPYPLLVQGLGAMALVLGLVVGAAIALSKLAPNMLMSALGLMAMAAALNMLLIPIITLGLLPYEVLQQGLTVLAGLLAGLVIAAIALNFLAPSMLLSAVGLMAMAVALNLLVSPIIILGMIPYQVLVTGILALVAVMAVLVVAAWAMTGAAAGAVGMVAMAAAILILSFAIAALAAVGMEGIGTALLGLVGAFAVMGLAALILGPVTPVILALAGALTIFALATMVIAVAMVVFSVGLMMLSPALYMATGALMAFAKVVPLLVEATPGIVAIGVALVAFGVGAAAAAIGTGALALALMGLGVAMLLLGAFGAIGAVALVAIVQAVTGLLKHIPGILAMSGAFTALGAALVVLGAGLVVVAIGAVATAVGMALLLSVGNALPGVLNRVQAALSKMTPMAPSLDKLGGSLDKTGDGLNVLGMASVGAASAIMVASTAIKTMTTVLQLFAAVSLTTRSAVMTSMTGMTKSVADAAKGIDAGSGAMVASMLNLNTKFAASAKTVVTTGSSLVSGLRNTLVPGLTGLSSSVGSAGESVGRAITEGMTRGLSKGSGTVVSAARTVASRALSAAKAELGVNSPSKEFEKVGVWSDEGLEKGFLGGTRGVVGAAVAVGSAALMAMRKALKDTSAQGLDTFDMSPTIRPVMDLSDIQRGTSSINEMLAMKRQLDISATYAKAARVNAQTGETASVNPELVPAGTSVTNIKFEQNNNSPKALSSAEIYRQTKNQLSVVRGSL